MAAQFLANDWLQVEFTDNGKGKASMKFLGKHGWEDVYVKGE